jgi:hypothetical protein
MLGVTAIAAARPPNEPMLYAVLALALLAPTPAPVDSVRADTDVREVVLRHTADVRRCYENEGLRRNPDLAGTVEIALTILPTGKVNEATLEGSDMAGPGTHEVVRCIATVARNWRFDRGAYLVQTIVFPFSFRPGRDAPRREITPAA